MPDRIAELKELLRADPDNTFLLYSLAQEHTRAGELPQAIAFYDRTIDIDPQYCYAYYHKAKCQEDAGDAAAARRTLEEGMAQAQEAGDTQAAREIQVFLDSLE